MQHKGGGMDKEINSWLLSATRLVYYAKYCSLKWCTSFPRCVGVEQWSSYSLDPSNWTSRICKQHSWEWRAWLTYSPGWELWLQQLSFVTTDSNTEHPGKPLCAVVALCPALYNDKLNFFGGVGGNWLSIHDSWWELAQHLKYVTEAFFHCKLLNC